MPDIYDTIASVNALLAQGTVVRVGAEHYSEHVAGDRRVLWVPAPDTFQAPPNRGHSARKPVKACVSKWQVLCWGKGDDKADPFASMRATTALRDEVLAAIHESAQGDYSVTGGAFDAQDGSSILQYGRLYILQVAFTTAVLERERFVYAPVARATATVHELGVSAEVVAEDIT